MPIQPKKLQWQMTVNIHHGPSFGHSVELVTWTVGRNEYATPIGSWRGMGLPEDVLKQIRASVDACISNHLTMRYGIAGELFDPKGYDPEPF